MKALMMIILLSVFNLFATTEVTIDRVEDGIATVEIAHNDYLQYTNVPAENFSIAVNDGDKLACTRVVGEFHNTFEAQDHKGNTHTYHQFRSYNDTVWWVLTEKQIGHTPEANQTYTLFYYDNNTTQCEHTDCECSLYDDIFLAIKGGI